jgi:hypothetical protein
MEIFPVPVRTGKGVVVLRMQIWSSARRVPELFGFLAETDRDVKTSELGTHQL